MVPWSTLSTGFQPAFTAEKLHGLQTRATKESRTLAKFYDTLNPELREFIAKQHLFFTASAAATGRVNLSPKGMDTFRVLSDTEVAYLDLTGSGNETAAHVRATGRMTFMWCSFDQRPWILRIYATARMIRPRDAEWQLYAKLFDPHPGMRQIVLARVQSVQTSCGYGVPQFEFRGDRPLLDQWAENKGDDGIRAYWAQKNQTSIDGLPTGLLDDAVKSMT